MKPLEQKLLVIGFTLMSMAASFLGGYVFANYNTVNHLAMTLEK